MRESILTDLTKIDRRTTREVEETRCQRKWGAERCSCGKPPQQQCVLGSVQARNLRVKRIKRELDRVG